MIAGLETQTSGDVYFGDRRVSRLSPSKRDIGMVFQYPVVYRGISVYRNIELPLQSMKLSKAERQRRVEDAIALMGLTASANLDVSKLDNGTRQKVSVAREVARQPQIHPLRRADHERRRRLEAAVEALTEGADSLAEPDDRLRHPRPDRGDDAGRPDRPHGGRQDRPVRPAAGALQPSRRPLRWLVPRQPGHGLLRRQAHRRRRLRSPRVAACSRLPSRSVGRCRAPATVTIGIRPEHIRVSSAPLPSGVPAQLVRKTVQIGGQYLVALQVNGDGPRSTASKPRSRPAPAMPCPRLARSTSSCRSPHVTLFDAAATALPPTLQTANGLMDN